GLEMRTVGLSLFTVQKTNEKALRFCARSTPRTKNEWLPLARTRLSGDWHNPTGALSTWHSKVTTGGEPGVFSGELNENDTLPTVIEPLAGPESMVTTGATRSIVQSKVAGVGSGMPSGSMACTLKW